MEEITTYVFYENERDPSDITVTLVQSPQAFQVVEAGGKEMKKLHKLPLHSKYLRAESGYFEAVLSERWSAGELQSTLPLEVTLEMQVDVGVEHYKECFSRLYMPAHRFSSVESCVQILKVAAQILYEDLMNSCMCFLATMPWSPEEEERIRELVMSLSLPTDCVEDISARLTTHKSKQELYSSLVEMIERTTVDQLVEGMVASRELHRLDRHFFAFARVFPEVMTRGFCPFMTKRLLAVVNDEITASFLKVKSIEQFDEDWNMVSTEFVLEVTIMCSLLDTVVESGVAKDAVAILGKDKELALCIKGWLEDDEPTDEEASLKKHCMETLFSIFDDVRDGKILLRSTVRAQLVKNWQTVLWRGDRARAEIVLNQLILKLPLNVQVKIHKDWKYIGLSETCDEDIMDDSEFIEAMSIWVQNLQLWPIAQLEAEGIAEIPGR